MAMARASVNATLYRKDSTFDDQESYPEQVNITYADFMELYRFTGAHDETSGKGWTPLRYAVLHSDGFTTVDVCWRLLLTEGADVFAPLAVVCCQALERGAPVGDRLTTAAPPNISPVAPRCHAHQGYDDPPLCGILHVEPVSDQPPPRQGRRPFRPRRSVRGSAPLFRVHAGQSDSSALDSRNRHRRKERPHGGEREARGDANSLCGAQREPRLHEYPCQRRSGYTCNRW